MVCPARGGSAPRAARSYCCGVAHRPAAASALWLSARAGHRVSAAVARQRVVPRQERPRGPPRGLSAGPADLFGSAAGGSRGRQGHFRGQLHGGRPGRGAGAGVPDAGTRHARYLRQVRLPHSSVRARFSLELLLPSAAHDACRGRRLCGEDGRLPSASASSLAQHLTDLQTHAATTCAALASPRERRNSFRKAFVHFCSTARGALRVC